MIRSCAVSFVLWGSLAAWACDDGGTIGEPDAPDSGVDADASIDEAPDAGGGVTPACSGLSEQPTDAEWAIEHGGRTRRLHIHVPPSYDPTRLTPLVFDFHGLTHDPEREMALTGMTELADDKGFVVVHPAGVGDSWNAGGCCGTAASEDVDDVGFVSAIIDAASSELCIDEDRVFATGMSNGGHFSYRLGCDLSDRIAAIAPVAGVNTADACEPARNIPIIHFHGTSDWVVPYGGNPVAGLPSVADSIEDWASRNGCDDTRTTVYENGDAKCKEFDGCPADARVVLCTVREGGHTWPGGDPTIGVGKTTDDLSASEAMWEFWMSLEP